MIYGTAFGFCFLLEAICFGASFDRDAKVRIDQIADEFRYIVNIFAARPPEPTWELTTQSCSPSLSSWLSCGSASS